MINPIFEVYVDVHLGYILERVEIDLTATQEAISHRLGFLRGYAEGISSFMPDEPVPIEVDNYDDLNEYERMRARELLVLLSLPVDGRKAVDLAAEVKTKLELDEMPPRVLVYQQTT